MTPSAPNTVLETARLVLREMDQGDLDFIADMLADPVVMRFWEHSFSRDEALDWIRRQRDRYSRFGYGYWLTLEKATGQPVGQVGVLPQRIEDVDLPGLGYIIHRPFWRRGFATEAALACRDYAFNRLNSPRVITLIRPENEPSFGVARKLGMQTEKHVEYGGFEHVLLSVTRNDPQPEG